MQTVKQKQKKKKIIVDMLIGPIHYAHQFYWISCGTGDCIFHTWNCFPILFLLSKEIHTTLKFTLVWFTQFSIRLMYTTSFSFSHPLAMLHIYYLKFIPEGVVWFFAFQIWHAIPNFSTSPLAIVFLCLSSLTFIGQ